MELYKILSLVFGCLVLLAPIAGFGLVSWLVLDSWLERRKWKKTATEEFLEGMKIGQHNTMCLIEGNRDRIDTMMGFMGIMFVAMGICTLVVVFVAIVGVIALLSVFLSYIGFEITGNLLLALVFAWPVVVYWMVMDRNVTDGKNESERIKSCVTRGAGHMTRKALPGCIAILIIWLAISGGHAGWANPIMLTANLLCGAALVGWFVWRLVSPGGAARTQGIQGVDWAIIAYFAASFLSLAGNPDAAGQGLWRVIVGVGYVVGLRLFRRLPEGAIIGGSVLAGWVLLPGMIIAGLGGNLWENPNIVADFPVILGPLGLYRLRGRRRWAWAALAGAAVLITGSRGGVVAMVVAWVVCVGVRWQFFALGAAGVAAAWILVPHSYTILSRFEFWNVAIDQFLDSPWIGQGVGSYSQLVIPTPWKEFQMMHAHNIILTTLAEKGAAGLLSLGVSARAGLRALRRSWRRRWAWAVIAGLLAHSMFDEPLHFWGSGLAFMAMVSLVVRDD